MFTVFNKLAIKKSRVHHLIKELKKRNLKEWEVNYLMKNEHILNLSY